MNTENITRFRDAVEAVEFARNHNGGSVTNPQIDELTEAANLADRELYAAEREIARLRDDLAESSQLRDRMADLLNGVATALKGAPGPLTLHDWTDLPELAADLKRAQIAADAVDPRFEPADGTLLVMCRPDGTDPEMVIIRDDAAARKGGYGDRRWFEVRPDGDDKPATWTEAASAVDWDEDGCWMRLVTPRPAN